MPTVEEGKDLEWEDLEDCDYAAYLVKWEDGTVSMVVAAGLDDLAIEADEHGPAVSFTRVRAAATFDIDPLGAVSLCGGGWDLLRQAFPVCRGYMESFIEKHDGDDRFPDGVIDALQRADRSVTPRGWKPMPRIVYELPQKLQDEVDTERAPRIQLRTSEPAQEAARPSRADTYVYLACAMYQGAVKIGMSSTPEGRAKQLTIDLKVNVELVVKYGPYTRPEARRREQAAHKALDVARVVRAPLLGTEWFLATIEDAKRHIAEVVL